VCGSPSSRVYDFLFEEEAVCLDCELSFCFFFFPLAVTPRLLRGLMD